MPLAQCLTHSKCRVFESSDRYVPVSVRTFSGVTLTLCCERTLSSHFTEWETAILNHFPEVTEMGDCRAEIDAHLPAPGACLSPHSSDHPSICQQRRKLCHLEKADGVGVHAVGAERREQLPP